MLEFYIKCVSEGHSGLKGSKIFEFTFRLDFGPSLVSFGTMCVFLCVSLLDYTTER